MAKVAQQWPAHGAVVMALLVHAAWYVSAERALLTATGEGVEESPGAQHPKAAKRYVSAERALLTATGEGVEESPGAQHPKAAKRLPPGLPSARQHHAATHKAPTHNGLVQVAYDADPDPHQELDGKVVQWKRMAKKGGRKRCVNTRTHEEVLGATECDHRCCCVRGWEKVEGNGDRHQHCQKQHLQVVDEHSACKQGSMFQRFKGLFSPSHTEDCYKQGGSADQCCCEVEHLAIDGKCEPYTEANFEKKRALEVERGETHPPPLEHGADLADHGTALRSNGDPEEEEVELHEGQDQAGGSHGPGAGRKSEEPHEEEEEPHEEQEEEGGDGVGANVTDHHSHIREQLESMRGWMFSDKHVLDDLEAHVDALEAERVEYQAKYNESMDAWLRAFQKQSAHSHKVTAEKKHKEIEEQRRFQSCYDNASAALNFAKSMAEEDENRYTSLRDAGEKFNEYQKALHVVTPRQLEESQPVLEKAIDEHKKTVEEHRKKAMEATNRLNWCKEQLALRKSNLEMLEDMEKRNKEREEKLREAFHKYRELAKLVKDQGPYSIGPALRAVALVESKAGSVAQRKGEAAKGS